MIVVVVTIDSRCNSPNNVIADDSAIFCTTAPTGDAQTAVNLDATKVDPAAVVTASSFCDKVCCGHSCCSSNPPHHRPARVVSYDQDASFSRHGVGRWSDSKLPTSHSSQAGFLTRESPSRWSSGRATKRNPRHRQYSVVTPNSAALVPNGIVVGGLYSQQQRNHLGSRSTNFTTNSPSRESLSSNGILEMMWRHL
uniref:Uncharacterized protein n=1 Tax=Romanomermis culicivorax TaxID=13658 RepID=A0A915KS52_ROMCU